MAIRIHEISSSRKLWTVSVISYICFTFSLFSFLLRVNCLAFYEVVLHHIVLVRNEDYRPYRISQCGQTNVRWKKNLKCKK